VFSPPPAVLASRRAEQARFGLPVWKLLGLGLVGVIAAARWWAERSLGGRRTACAPAGSIPSSEPVLRDEQAQVLLADVRRVLERHGMSCGRMPLRVRVGDINVEGLAVSAAAAPPPKTNGPPPSPRPPLAVRAPKTSALSPRQIKSGNGRHRWMEGIEIRSGLDSLHAAHVRRTKNKTRKTKQAKDKKSHGRKERGTRPWQRIERPRPMPWRKNAHSHSK
jgi:hypothetical protein